MVEATLTQDPASPFKNQDEERRGTGRIPCNLETSCRPLMARDGYTWLAQVRDISRGGVGLLAPRRFERGTVLTLDLVGPNKKITHTVLARVAHATKKEEGKWLIGCAFTTEMDEEELRQFGIQRVRSDIPDCRAWVRMPCDLEVACQPAEAQAPASPWLIKVVNLSPAGLGLLVPHAVDKGALLYVELPDASGKEEHPVLVRVVHQQATEAGWQLGCEFATQLSEDEIQGLLE